MAFIAKLFSEWVGQGTGTWAQLKSSNKPRAALTLAESQAQKSPKSLYILHCPPYSEVCLVLQSRNFDFKLDLQSAESSPDLTYTNYVPMML